MPEPASGFTQDPASRLILASQSASRRALLRAAGLDFDAVVSGVDEDALAASGRGPAEIACELAATKALAVSRRPDCTGAWVIGCDQTASCEGRLFNKPPSLEAAREALRFLSGRTHYLHSAVALAKGGRIVWSHLAEPALTMRRLSETFIDAYIAAEGEALLSSAGAYRLEGLGMHLFSAITGEHAAILGLPMMALLTELRNRGVLLG